MGSSGSAFNSPSSAILPRSKRVATLVRLAFVAIAQKAVQYSLNGLLTVGADSLGYGQLETATAWNIPAFP